MRTYAGQHINAALAGHRNVHDQYIDRAVPHQGKRLVATRGFARDADLFLLAEKLPQPGADDAVLVHARTANHALIPPERRRRARTSAARRLGPPPLPPPP